MQSKSKVYYTIEILDDISEIKELKRKHFKYYLNENISSIILFHDNRKEHLAPKTGQIVTQEIIVTTLQQIMAPTNTIYCLLEISQSLISNKGDVVWLKALKILK